VFSVELGALIMAESTIVPFFSIRFLLFRSVITWANSLSCTPAFINKFLNRHIVSPFGTSSGDDILKKPENARLSITGSAVCIPDKLYKFCSK